MKDFKKMKIINTRKKIFVLLSVSSIFMFSINKVGVEDEALALSLKAPNPIVKVLNSKETKPKSSKIEDLKLVNEKQNTPKITPNKQKPKQTEVNKISGQYKLKAPSKIGQYNKKVFITFDDGPSKSTNQIIGTLDKYGAKATFFMLEPNMKRFPESVKNIVKKGHIPALHGVSHQVSKIYQSEKTVVGEMKLAQKTLFNISGATTNLIRTPYGSYPYMKPSYKHAVEEAGFQLWDWTIDSEDWKYGNDQYVKNVTKQLEHYPFKDKPVVILLHDRKSTNDHLPALLTYLKKNGYGMEVIDNQMVAVQF